MPTLPKLNLLLTRRFHSMVDSFTAMCKYLSWSSASDCQRSGQIGSLTTFWHDHIACIVIQHVPAEKQHFGKWACAETWTCSFKWSVLSHPKGRPLNAGLTVSQKHRKSHDFHEKWVEWLWWIPSSWFAGKTSEVVSIGEFLSMNSKGMNLHFVWPQ